MTTIPPSAFGKHVLKPFLVGSKVTAHSLRIFLAFALMMVGVATIIAAICGTMYGYWWLIHRSAWYIIPLSVPIVLVMIWMIGAAAISTREAAERNAENYAVENEPDFGNHPTTFR